MESKFNEVIMTRPQDYDENKKVGWSSRSRININKLTKGLSCSRETIEKRFNVKYKPEYIIAVLNYLADNMTIVNVIRHLNYRQLSEMMYGIISAKRLTDEKVLDIMEAMNIIHRNKEKQCMVNPVLAFACKAGDPVKGHFTRSWDYVYGLYQNFKEMDVIDYTYYQTDPEYASVANDPLEWSSYNKKRDE